MTDWRAPSGSTLARLSDPRVEQFWDPRHNVSKELAEMVRPSSSRPQPNSGKGFYWDEAILYGPNSRWESAPKSLFWQGPVYRVIPGLETALRATAHEAR